MKDVPDLEAQRDTGQDQLKLACSLVDTMATSFGAIELQDRYTDASNTRLVLLSASSR